ncbi:MAG: alpha/beta hydrolase [Eubacteriales bacterium]|nr:alpha/beta hydrolase [Eubacteriales bacterium]
MQTTVHGCRIFYEITPGASADAPRVLLLHGWGCEHGYFSPITNALAREATVASLDFPGHGQSDEPPEPWDASEFAAQVAELIRENGLAPVQIIGHSHGGRIALKLAIEYPELVGKLIITGGAGLRKPETEKSGKRTANYKRYSAFLNRMKTIPTLSPIAEKMQTALRNRYGSPDYVKLNENMRRTFVKLVTEDLTPQLSRIQAPTLLVWGDADTETPLWMGETMEKLIPDAGLVVFTGGTHFAFLEQWQRFTVIAKQFFMEEHA